jgi:hypothetical protein
MNNNDAKMDLGLRVLPSVVDRALHKEVPGKEELIMSKVTTFTHHTFTEWCTVCCKNAFFTCDPFFVDFSLAAPYFCRFCMHVL